MEILFEPALTILDVFMIYQTSTLPQSNHIPTDTEEFIWRKVLQMDTKFNFYIYTKLITALHNQWNGYKKDYEQKGSKIALTIEKHQRGVSDADYSSQSIHLRDNSRDNSHINIPQLVCPPHSQVSPALVSPTKYSPKRTSKTIEMRPSTTFYDLVTPPLEDNVSPPAPSPFKLNKQSITTSPSALSKCLAITPRENKPQLVEQTKPRRRSLENFNNGPDFELIARGESAIRERRRTAAKNSSVKKLRRTESQYTIPTGEAEWKLFETTLQHEVKKNPPKNVVDHTKDLTLKDSITDKYLNQKFNAIDCYGGAMRIVLNAFEVGVSAGALNLVMKNDISSNFIQEHIKYYNGLKALSTLYINTIKPFCSNEFSHTQALKAFDKTFPPIMALERRILRLFNQQQNEAIPKVIEWYAKELLCYALYIERLSKIRSLVSMRYSADIQHTLNQAITEYEEAYGEVEKFETLIESPMMHLGRTGLLIFSLLNNNSNHTQTERNAAKKYIQIISSVSTLPLKKLNNIFQTDFKKVGRTLIHFGGVKITSKDIKGKEWRMMLLFNDFIVIAKVDINDKYKSEKDVLIKFENAPSGITLDALRKYSCKIEMSYQVDKLVARSDKSYSFTLNTMVCVCFNMKEKTQWINSLLRAGVQIL
ncbi:PH domain-containing protein [Entamoeba marina]